MSVVGQAKKDVVANPNAVSEVDGTFLNVANGDIGDADTSYSYIPWGTQGFKYGVIQAVVEATTLTVEATADPSSVTDANATWIDVTNALFGVANLTATTALIIDTPVTWSRLRVKRLTTNATNSLVLKLTRSN